MPTVHRTRNEELQVRPPVSSHLHHRIMKRNLGTILFVWAGRSESPPKVPKVTQRVAAGAGLALDMLPMQSGRAGARHTRDLPGRPRGSTGTTGQFQPLPKQRWACSLSGCSRRRDHCIGLAPRHASVRSSAFSVEVSE